MSPLLVHDEVSHFYCVQGRCSCYSLVQRQWKDDVNIALGGFF